MSDTQLINRLLQVIEEDIIPSTISGIANGNKIFGAAILRKSDLSVVLVETNNEIENPLWHGEIHCLKKFYELPPELRPSTKECIFLSTHEPCSLCLSAITWTGFDNFYYFFTHEDSRDAFAIPHDLVILKEVFNIAPGGYNKENSFWKSHSIKNMIQEKYENGLINFDDRVRSLERIYNDLSQKYQENKKLNNIPLN